MEVFQSAKCKIIILIIFIQSLSKKFALFFDEVHILIVNIMEHFISKIRNNISFNLYSSEIYKGKLTNIEHKSSLILGVLIAQESWRKF